MRYRDFALQLEDTMVKFLVALDEVETNCDMTKDEKTTAFQEVCNLYGIPSEGLEP